MFIALGRSATCTVSGGVIPQQSLGMGRLISSRKRILAIPGDTFHDLRSMNRAPGLIGFAYSIVVFAPTVLLAQLATDPAGFNRIPCPGGSDTVVSIPFSQSPVFTGKLSASPVSASGETTITPDGTFTLGVNEFADAPHYLRFREGSVHDGAWFEVVSNDASTITIETGSEDVTDSASGDLFDIVPHWTLATIWPKDTQESLHISTNKLASGRESTVLFADVTAAGTSLAPNRIYFLTVEGWFQSTAGFPVADDEVIPRGRRS